MITTKEDIIAAYKIFLNRLPESVQVVTARVGQNSELNLIDFTLSDEFLKRPEVAEIIARATKIALADQVQTPDSKSLN